MDKCIEQHFFLQWYPQLMRLQRRLSEFFNLSGAIIVLGNYTIVSLSTNLLNYLFKTAFKAEDLIVPNTNSVMSSLYSHSL